MGDLFCKHHTLSFALYYINALKNAVHELQSSHARYEKNPFRREVCFPQPSRLKCCQLVCLNAAHGQRNLFVQPSTDSSTIKLLFFTLHDSIGSRGQCIRPGMPLPTFCFWNSIQLFLEEMIQHIHEKKGPLANG